LAMFVTQPPVVLLHQIVEDVEHHLVVR